MDWAQYYAQLSEMARAGQELGFFDNFFRLFYQAFIEGNRWQLYLRGLAVTLQLTVIALCIGIVLGVLVRWSAPPTTSSGWGGEAYF